MRLFLSIPAHVAILLFFIIGFTRVLSADGAGSSPNPGVDAGSAAVAGPESPANSIQFDSRDYFATPGYSGRPIEVDLEVDKEGNFQSLILGKHQEPIFLSPEGRASLQTFLDQYRGLSVHDKIAVHRVPRPLTFEPHANSKEVVLDGVTSATITVRALHRSVVGGTAKALLEDRNSAHARPSTEADPEKFEPVSIEELQESGWLLRWRLSREQAENMLGRKLSDYKYQRYDFGRSGDFIDLWAAWLNPPSIGTAVLGATGYQKLMESLFVAEKGSHKNAFLFASAGLHKHVISGYKQGDALHRLTLHQDSRKFSFQDAIPLESATRLVSPWATADLAQILVLRDNNTYDPGVPATIQLSMRRKGKYIMSNTSYFESSLPLVTDLLRPITTAEVALDIGGWQSIWSEKKTTIAVLLFSLTLLSVFFIAQRKLLAYHTSVRRFRLVFLIFTLFFIGFWTQGQLSVTNIFTLVQALKGEIPWSFFLTDPVIFILWSYVFISLFLWGRGLYCGWLCPFGVLQEFASILGKKLALKQWRIGEKYHRRMQWLKYLVLVLLVGVALKSQVTATQLSEVEPFKTAITQYFIRGLPYVMYAVALLLLGLVLHKPFCRYLCPLGAGLAVIGVLRRFSLLDRRAECGSPCQLCRNKCEIAAIEPSGKIDYNECVQCMECVVILHTPTECAVTMRTAKRDAMVLTEIRC